jgi:putative spermidine/putrescine transport system permease protein
MLSIRAPRRLRIRWGKWALLAAVAAVYAFILSPVAFVSWIAFFDQGVIAFPPEGYTLRWFQEAWERRTFQRGFVTSLQVALVAMATGVSLGALASIALVRYRFPGRDTLSTLLLSPLIVPGVVAGTAIYIFFVQVDDAFDFRMRGTLPGLVLAHVMITLPWAVRLISASLVGIDRSVEDAAMNLGADRWTTFRRVTFPMMRAGLVAASLFSFITSFENLELTLFLVGPGRTTLPIAILQHLEFKVDPLIAAVAFVQILLIGALMLATDRFVKLSRVV